MPRMSATWKRSKPTHAPNFSSFVSLIVAVGLGSLFLSQIGHLWCNARPVSSCTAVSSALTYTRSRLSKIIRSSRPLNRRSLLKLKKRLTVINKKRLFLKMASKIQRNRKYPRYNIQQPYAYLQNSKVHHRGCIQETGQALRVSRVLVHYD